MPNINEILLNSFKNENIAVSDSQLAQFIRYYELLLEWNEKINLTAITEPADVAVKHFADSLLALKMLPDDNWQNKKMIDIGTGAGFPAIPLKIMKQSLDVILFDSLQKRLNFFDAVRSWLAPISARCTAAPRTADRIKRCASSMISLAPAPSPKCPCFWSTLCHSSR